MNLNHNTSTDKLQFKVLAPDLSDVPQHMRGARVDPGLHERCIVQTQLVRGLALRECCPTEAHLLPDGRHIQSVDTESWHILLEDSDGLILGCARYRPIWETLVNWEPTTPRLRILIVTGLT